MKTIKTKLLYTGKNEKPLKNVFITFDKKFIKISKKGNSKEVYEVITPAFIDAHSHVGMEKQGEPWQEGEANEHIGYNKKYKICGYKSGIWT